MKYLLTDIPGIKKSTAELLTKHGIDSVQALIDGGERALSMVPGFGAIRAANVLKAAKNLKHSDQAVEKSPEAGAKTTKKAEKAAKAEAKANKKAEKAAKKATKAARKLKKKKSKDKK